MGARRHEPSSTFTQAHGSAALSRSGASCHSLLRCCCIVSYLQLSAFDIRYREMGIIPCDTRRPQPPAASGIGPNGNASSAIQQVFGR